MDEEDYIPLFDAIKGGDVAAVESFLQTPGIDVGFAFFIRHHFNWYTPLNWAIYCKQKTIAAVLLAHGAAVNGPVDANRTPLQMACESFANEDIIKLLLELGADVDAMTARDRETPLTIACCSEENLGIVQLLINSGADVNGSDGVVAPLHKVAYYGNIEALELLIEAGADANKISTGEDYHLPAGSTPLHIACHAGQLSVMITLLAAGADPNIVNARGETPLHEAALCGKREIVELLIEAGANVNIASNDENDNITAGCTPLHFAVFEGQWTCLTTLLAAGVDPNIANADGQTPLHSAINMPWASSVDVINALLAVGSDPLHRDYDGSTPLQFLYESHRTRGFSAKQYNAITALVAAGDRSWECVPTPCPGLEAAMVSVLQAAPDELSELVKRLSKEMKKVVQEVLRVLHHHFAGFPEVKEQLLKSIFEFTTCV